MTRRKTLLFGISSSLLLRSTTGVGSGVKNNRCFYQDTYAVNQGYHEGMVIPVEFELEACTPVPGPRFGTMIYVAVLTSPAVVDRDRLAELYGRPINNTEHAPIICGVESYCMQTLRAGAPLGLLTRPAIVYTLTPPVGQ